MAVVFAWFVYAWYGMVYCKILAAFLMQIEGQGYSIVRVDCSKTVEWAPEMLAYNVEMVPCFVLLDAQGTCRNSWWGYQEVTVDACVWIIN